MREDATALSHLRGKSAGVDGSLGRRKRGGRESPRISARRGPVHWLLLGLLWIEGSHSGWIAGKHVP
jgi:hypothetical protein